MGIDADQRSLCDYLQEFWDTRTSGHAAIWQAIRLACDAMLQDDYALAATILEAAEVRVPHGTLEQCYDSRGAMYSVPRYCFSDPTNVVSCVTDHHCAE